MVPERLFAKGWNVKFAGIAADSVAGALTCIPRCRRQTVLGLRLPAMFETHYRKCRWAKATPDPDFK